MAAVGNHGAAYVRHPGTFEALQIPIYCAGFITAADVLYGLSNRGDALHELGVAGGIVRKGAIPIEASLERRRPRIGFRISPAAVGCDPFGMPGDLVIEEIEIALFLAGDELLRHARNGVKCKMPDVWIPQDLVPWRQSRHGHIHNDGGVDPA